MKNMLTESQIKNLKKGDKLIAEVSFIRVSHDNDLICLVPVNSTGGNVIDAAGFYHQACLSLPPAEPKYDPARRFKKGDKVRLKVVNGRIPCHSDDGFDLPWNGVIYTVELDEDKSASANCVLLSCAELGLFVKIHVSHIELITPVEERVSFRVGDFSVNGEWSVWKDSLGKTEIVSSYKIDTHPNARKAAEEERDRLNAEHRKEQK